MGRNIEQLGTLTILSGQTTSDVLDSEIGFGNTTDLAIITPAALTGTVKPYMGGLEDGSDAKKLNVGGTDVTLPAACFVPLPTSAFRSLKLVSSAAEGADRVFKVMGQIHFT